MAKPSFIERLYRWSGRHARGIDYTIAAAFVLLALATIASTTSWSILVVSLGMTVPLAWRRTRPTCSGFAVAGFAYLHLILLDQMQPVVLAVFPAVYALAAYAPSRASRAGLVLAVLGASGASVRYMTVTGTTTLALVVQATFFSLTVVAVWAFGAMRRLRVNELQGLTERARLLELEREQEAELAAVNERTRIAREMHDIVAHSLTVVIAQADGGRYGAAADPKAAVAALETISATGRQALADMRALLSVLREDRPRDYTATPGADDIAGLVEEVRRSGLRIELTVVGEPQELSTGAGLTVYRIVQESLTNVLKHAGPAAQATITITWERSVVRLDITDTGRGAAAALVQPSSGGQGLVGMAERARLHGGTFEAGPRTGGGFRVQARLPYEH